MYSQRTNLDHETYPLKNYGFTADSRTQNKEFMSKVPQAMPQLDPDEKLLQCQFTERSYRHEYQCVSYI